MRKIFKPLLVTSILCIIMLSLPLAQAEAAFRSWSGGHSQGVNSSSPQTGSHPAAGAGSQPQATTPNDMPPLKYTWNDYSSIQYSTVFCGPNGQVNCSKPFNNDFGFSDTVYLFGYVAPGQNSISIGIYDGAGNLVDTIVGESLAAPYGRSNPAQYCLVGPGGLDRGTGEMFPSISFSPKSFTNCAEGNWTACVFKGDDHIPPTCPKGNNCLCECHFKCHKGIPEFPSAAAPVAVVGLCGMIYVWLRKRREAAPAA